MSNDQNSKEKEIQNQDKHFAIDQVDPEIIRKWTQEQLENREKLKLYDTEPWQINRQVFDDLNEYPNYQNEKLRYVAGLDISFVKDEDTACSGLFVFDLKDNFKCVYKDLELIKMDQPYVPGFLAYREAPFLLKKLEKLKINKLNYYPHCIFIDGNGLLHGNKFGMACHIGYHSDTPTIGVTGDCFELRSRLEGDNSLLGYCYRSTDQSSNPVYVSIGNKISWSTCLWILKLVVKKYRIPEPIRQADLLTRDFLKNL
ncbi:unnamed protein product [Brachionus calyciflorus]|uniref:Endonuclease V n=1 Tax=Brachionus calyciflorus TaxID=104777 RepID=A0A813ZRB2_9BILA|nr:unnamed protein product [Brachionus calyciflorus]